jgi:arylsulfatase A-like enzyme
VLRTQLLSRALAVLLVLLALRSCQPAGRHNVILISIDTLRADHLGCYGYQRDTTPRIDSFRRDASLFELAIAQAPSTLPSHASMFTSLLPRHHGASIANDSGIDPAAPTLAAILKREGYATASFNGGIQLDPLYGLSRGFDTYVSARPSGADAEVLVDPVDRFDHVVSAAMQWIRDRNSRPWFLFLHTYEIHHPYTPDPALLALMNPDYDGALPDRISVDLLQRINRGETAVGDADIAHIEATYDAELRSVDTAFGTLVDFLRSQGLYDDAVIVVTSDHGEEFGEHGFVGWHSHSLYDELLRVPLLVKLPGSRGGGRSVAAQVTGIDLAPTILDALDVAIPHSFAGHSLLPAIAGAGNGREYVVSQRDVDGLDEHDAIRSRRWKWSRGGLFHLESDPLETTDVSLRNGDTAQAMSRMLAEILAARPRPQPHRVEPDEALRERLRSLGYLE